ncbi:hypothetical protein FRUB_09059 [Fimbriiglobus ruber]|uniref:Uncharacterized protein n=1 Tax=Fimbriiglobus ruber TaxID=1908690 RepID=A0A225DGK5_9BACT|nr:hypothetical protein FRUB_09059 [Fimbriiglobus ruber]
MYPRWGITVTVLPPGRGGLGKSSGRSSYPSHADAAYYLFVGR